MSGAKVEHNLLKGALHAVIDTIEHDQMDSASAQGFANRSVRCSARPWSNAHKMILKGLGHCLLSFRHITLQLLAWPVHSSAGLASMPTCGCDTPPRALPTATACACGCTMIGCAPRLWLPHGDHAQLLFGQICTDMIVLISCRWRTSTC